MSVPETVIKSVELPGSTLGLSAPTVPVDVVYSNEKTIWVEPVSGVIVTSVEKPKTEMHGPDGETVATVLSGTFGADKKTVADGAKRAKDYKTEITLIKTTLPLILLVLGLLLLLVGALLLRRSRTGAHRSTDTVEVEAVREPQVW
jgi:hypothetical protein